MSKLEISKCVPQKCLTFCHWNKERCETILNVAVHDDAVGQSFVVSRWIHWSSVCYFGRDWFSFRKGQSVKFLCVASSSRIVNSGLSIDTKISFLIAKFGNAKASPKKFACICFVPPTTLTLHVFSW